MSAFQYDACSFSTAVCPSVQQQRAHTPPRLGSPTFKAQFSLLLVRWASALEWECRSEMSQVCGMCVLGPGLAPPGAQGAAVAAQAPLSGLISNNVFLMDADI